MTEPEEAVGLRASSERVTVEITGAFEPSAAKVASEALKRMQEAQAPAIEALEALQMEWNQKLTTLRESLPNSGVHKFSDETKRRWATERLRERRLMASRGQAQSGRSVRRRTCDGGRRRPGARRRDRATSSSSSGDPGGGEPHAEPALGRRSTFLRRSSRPHVARIGRQAVVV